MTILETEVAGSMKIVSNCLQKGLLLSIQSLKKQMNGWFVLLYVSSFTVGNSFKGRYLFFIYSLIFITFLYLNHRNASYITYNIFMVCMHI